MVNIDEELMDGKFIGETENHWIFLEKGAKSGKIEKKHLRGKPPMNEEGRLTLDASYIAEKINGEYYLTGGLSGRLITFKVNPF